MNERDAGFEDETKVQPDDEVVSARGILDGAQSLDEAAALARLFAAMLDDLHERGYRLRKPVEAGLGFIYLPDAPGREKSERGE